MSAENIIWVEEYRPEKINDIIMPDRYKDLFNNMIENENIQHMLLSGSPGTGKTTAAIALCKELGFEYKINNSKE